MIACTYAHDKWCEVGLADSRIIRLCHLAKWCGFVIGAATSEDGWLISHSCNAKMCQTHTCTHISAATIFSSRLVFVLVIWIWVYPLAEYFPSPFARLPCLLSFGAHLRENRHSGVAVRKMKFSVVIWGVSSHKNQHTVVGNRAPA